MNDEDILDRQDLGERRVESGQLSVPAREAIDQLLHARSVVVIGASSSTGKIGNVLFQYLRQYSSGVQLFPVNAREDEIDGLRCYRSVQEVPEPVDLACIAVPAAAVLSVVDDCVQAGVKAAIVFSSGFKESGRDDLQQALTERTRAGGLRFIGPNSQGLINIHERFCPTFSQCLQREPVPGEIVFVSQSGAMGGSSISRAWEQSLGFRAWISSGNEADLETADFVKYFVSDPATRVVALFMEGLKNPDSFRVAAEMAATAQKPIVVYKTGRSPVGRLAVQSHTGSDAGADEEYEALFKQYGITRVGEIMELFDVAMGFAWAPLPAGDRVGIVSTSGGACSILADACYQQGLRVPELAPATQEILRQYIPDYGTVRNPVDITAQAGSSNAAVRAIIDAVGADDNVDSLIIQYATRTDPRALEGSQETVAAARAIKKPVLVAWTIARSLAPRGMDYLVQNHIPLYLQPEKAVLALRAMVDYARFQSRRQ